MIAVHTVGEICKKCYSCVRACPTKALEVHSGQAQINPELCISCGYCVTMCSQGAKRIRSSVDEVRQILSSEALHMIRTLSNLETPEEKLVTMILFAEENFVRRLAHRSYSSLRGRIALRGDLGGLSVVETEQLLKFRVLVAGGQPDLFAPDAFEEFQEQTGGIPREIAKLAYNALLEAHLLGREQIDADLLIHCKKKGW